MLTVHGIRTLSGIPPEPRNNLYEELDKPALGRLCLVASQFRDEIYENDCYITFKANNLAQLALSGMDDLLKYTQKYGKQVKWLDLILDKCQRITTSTDSKDQAVEEYQTKLTKAIRNCPKLTSLFLKNENELNVDYMGLFDAVNSSCLPHLPHLKQLGFEDSRKVMWENIKSLNGLGVLNIEPLKNLKKIILNRVELHESLLQQLKELPDSIEMQLEIHCYCLKIPESIINALQSKANCRIVWNLNDGGMFPSENLKLLQQMKCRQTVTFKFDGFSINHNKIKLLEPFEYVCLQIVPSPYCKISLEVKLLENQIKDLLPKLNFKIQSAPQSLIQNVYI